jgi:hypothetical protein
LKRYSNGGRSHELKAAQLIMYQIETYRGIIGDSEAAIRVADVDTTNYLLNSPKAGGMELL